MLMVFLHELFYRTSVLKMSLYQNQAAINLGTSNQQLGKVYITIPIHLPKIWFSYLVVGIERQISPQIIIHIINRFTFFKSPFATGTLLCPIYAYCDTKVE